MSRARHIYEVDMGPSRTQKVPALVQKAPRADVRVGATSSSSTGNVVITAAFGLVGAGIGFLFFGGKLLQTGVGLAAGLGAGYLLAKDSSQNQGA